MQLGCEAVRLVGRNLDPLTRIEEQAPKSYRRLFWLLRGTAMLSYDQDITTGLRSGSMVHLRADTSFDLAMTHTSSALAILVPKTFLIRLPNQNFTYQTTNNEALQRIGNLFEDIFAERDGLADQGAELLHNLIDQLALRITALRRQEADDLQSDKTVEYQELVRVMQSKPAQEISQETLAQALGISQAALGRLCKSETGNTVNQIIKQDALRRAQEMLLSTDDGIDVIAKTLGFDTPVLFSRFFENQVGISPLSYRTTATRPN